MNLEKTLFPAVSFGISAGKKCLLVRSIGFGKKGPVVYSTVLRFGDLYLSPPSPGPWLDTLQASISEHARRWNTLYLRLSELPVPDELSVLSALYESFACSDLDSVTQDLAAAADDQEVYDRLQLFLAETAKIALTNRPGPNLWSTAVTVMLGMAYPQGYKVIGKVERLVLR